MPAIVNAPEIRRRPYVPPEKRTPAREEVARYVETEVLADGAWPVTMTELADATGYSRTLVTEALDIYFEPAESDRDETLRARYIEQIDVEVPVPNDLDEVETQAYLRGFRQGFLQDYRR